MKKLPQAFSHGWKSDLLAVMLLLLLGAAGFTLRAMAEKLDPFQTNATQFSEKFDAFRAGSNTFLNVAVLSANRTDIFLQHSGGLVNVKVKDVDPEILKQLGYKVAEPESKTGKNALGPISNQMITNLTQKLEANPQYQALENRWHAQLAPRMPPNSKGLIAGVIGAFVAVYLFFSFCCMLIVKKTGNQPGILVWLPIVKMLPLIRAAGMPGWWFLLWIMPLLFALIAIPLIVIATIPASWLPFICLPASIVSLVSGVFWCFKIVETRGKSVLWAILLLLPVTNLLAFLYLAFSDGAAPDDKTAARPLARAA